MAPASTSKASKTTWNDVAGWQPVPASSDAESAVVDVFRIQVPESAEDFGWLSPEDRERVERLAHDAQRQRFVTGRTVLRALLGRALDCAPGEVPLSTGAHGKPGVPDAVSRGFAFNVSHTERCVLVAIGSVERVGIDVERVREGLDFERLARRVLAASERAALPEDEVERRQLFFRLWAAKESYLKAWGTGLSFGAARCEMGIGLDQPLRLLSSQMAGERPERWEFVDLDAGTDLKACVCWPGSGVELRCWDLEQAALPAFAKG